MSQPDSNSGQLTEADKVYVLIKAMYSQGEFKDFASTMLENFQKSIFAWKVADELLIKKLDYESCYFAAQTLKMKTQHSLHELPIESIDSLKDSIINHIINMDHKVINTQLCLCVTFIYFSHPNWLNPIEELLGRLSREKFFEVISMIAQEFEETRNTRLTKPKDDQISLYLKQNVPTVMHLLMEYYNSANTVMSLDRIESALSIFFHCFEAWVSYFNEGQLTSIESPLGVIFEYLQRLDISQSLHEKATDALCKIIFKIEGGGVFSLIMKPLTEQIFKLEDSYHKAVGYEDPAKIINFARIFTELGNSSLEEISEGQIDNKILHLIINCVSNYDFEVAETTFSFLYNFSEEIYKRSTTNFVGWFNLLLSSLSRHCQLEPDTVGLIDLNSEHFDYRDQVKVLLEDILPCTDWVTFLQNINIGQVLRTSNWEVTEMYLYIIYCIVSNQDAFEVPVSGSDPVTQEIVNFILSLKPSDNSIQPWPHVHLQIYATSCDVLGQLNTWLDHNPTFVEPAIGFLIQIINQSYNKETRLTSLASQALREIIKLCVTCSLNLQTIYSLFTNMLFITTQLSDLDPSLNISIISCCTAIVSNKNVVESDQQEGMFIQLLQLCVAKIDGISEQKTNLDSFYESAIDTIYSTFKNFKPNEQTRNSVAVHTALQQKIWPFVKTAISTFADSTESSVVEHSSRCVRHIVRSMKPMYLLEQIVEFIVPTYQKYPFNSPLLYIGSVLVDEFANRSDQILCNGLILMLNSFLDSTLNFLKEHGLNRNPFTVDDFFNLCYRMLNRLTEHFLSNTEALNNILNLLTMSFKIDQKETSESLAKFSVEFIKIESPVVDSYINSEFGQNLVFSIIDAIIFNLPSYFMQDLIDPLWNLKLNYPAKFTEAIRYTASTLSEKAKQNNNKVTSADLERFCNNITGASNQKRFVVELRAIQKLF